MDIELFFFLILFSYFIEIYLGNYYYKKKIIKNRRKGDLKKREIEDNFKFTYVDFKQCTMNFNVIKVLSHLLFQYLYFSLFKQ